jgi:hypothetical protein
VGSEEPARGGGTGDHRRRLFRHGDRHRLLVFGLLIDRSKRPLHGLIWPQAGFASIAYAAMAPVNFLPLPAAPSFLAKQETSPAAILR